MRIISKYKIPLIGLLAGLLSFLIVSVFFSWRCRIPFNDWIHALYHLPYKGSVNIFLGWNILGMSINQLFFVIILVAAALVYLMMKVLRIHHDSIVLKKAIFFSVLFCFMLLLSMQASSQFMFFERGMLFLTGKNFEQRTLLVHGDIYKYALACRKILPGKHTAKLITDMDMSRDPGMYNHRVLSYFLYPIDIREVRRDLQDCLVVYNKDRPQEAVPSNYKIILVHGQRSLLAVKKESEQ